MQEFYNYREADVQMVNPNDYTAPENFSDDVPYTFVSDIWSIATLLYEVVTGCRPKHFEVDVNK